MLSHHLFPVDTMTNMAGLMTSGFGLREDSWLWKYMGRAQGTMTRMAARASVKREVHCTAKVHRHGGCPPSDLSCEDREILRWDSSKSKRAWALITSSLQTCFLPVNERVGLMVHYILPTLLSLTHFTLMARGEACLEKPWPHSRWAGLLNSSVSSAWVVVLKIWLMCLATDWLLLWASCEIFFPMW